MAKEEELGSRVLKDAPKTLKADIWQHFGFYEVDGKLDKAHAVCKTCHAKIKRVAVVADLTVL